jgi:hypothetical protein
MRSRRRACRGDAQAAKTRPAAPKGHDVDHPPATGLSRAMIDSTMIRRTASALAIAAIVIVGTLCFVDNYAKIDEAKRCATTFAKSQWPQYIGCIMAAHESLAAGLIGGAGALIAAWVAWNVLQAQLSAESDQQRYRESVAKEVAVLAITPAIHAAAMTLLAIDDAMKATELAGKADELVSLAATLIRSALDSFAVRESVRELGFDEKLAYLTIVGILQTFVSLSANPSPVLNRMQHLHTLRHALMKNSYLSA